MVPGREAKGPGGSDVEFLRQLVKEQQAQLNEAVRAVNAATQAAAAATQALNEKQANEKQANLALMQASTAHAAGVVLQVASMSTVAVSAMDPSRAPAPAGQPKVFRKMVEGLE